jgi:hypothetical protein
MPLNLCYGSHTNNFLNVPIKSQSMILCLGGKVGLNLGS